MPEPPKLIYLLCAKRADRGADVIGKFAEKLKMHARTFVLHKNVK